MYFFTVTNYEGKRRIINGEAVDVIYQSNPRDKETKIITRSGATVVTNESFKEVMEKYDECLRKIRICKRNGG